MTDEIQSEAFLTSAEAWVCDGYSLDVRFLAGVEDHINRIWNASISLNPLQAPRDLGFRIDTVSFVVGQTQRYPESKNSLLAILARAASGVIDLPDRELVLTSDRPLYFRSEMSDRDRWFSELHLQVVGGVRPPPSPATLAEIDNTLRSSSPPFDGLSDVAGWLGLDLPGGSPHAASISVRVGPPVDLILDKCVLADDCLKVTLHAHPAFVVDHAGLAVRAVPGDALNARKQVTREIKWGTVQDGRREGVAQIALQHADNALVMLMIGTSTVRRHWFLDPTKARNNRLLAIQHFDKDLRMVKQAVTESSDSSKFEKGVAALLFLLGFSPSVQLETDAPDLIVTTPGGRLAIVECTTRIADVPSKIGKLVDRRGALAKSLQSSGHAANVAAVLVCRLPRDQIAAHAEELRAHNTILVAGEDLTAGFERVRFPNDPDRMLDEFQAHSPGTLIRLTADQS